MAPKGRWWCFDRKFVQGYAPPRQDFHTTDVAKHHPQVVAWLATAYDEWLKRANLI